MVGPCKLSSKSGFKMFGPAATTAGLIYSLARVDSSTRSRAGRAVVAKEVTDDGICRRLFN